MFDEAYLPSSESAETEALAASSVLMQSTSPDRAAACSGVNPDPPCLSASTTTTLGTVLVCFAGLLSVFRAWQYVCDASGHRGVGGGRGGRGRGRGAGGLKDDLLTPYGGDHTHRYWCSESSTEQPRTDTLQFELVHPVRLVKEVRIEPFTEDPEASLSLGGGGGTAAG